MPLPVIHIDSSGGTGIGWTAQVEFRANLPITVGAPAIGTIYLVEKPTTILLGTYTTYQSGLYYRDNNTGSLSDWRRLNVKIHFTDNEFIVVSAGDESKRKKDDLSLLTTATTRVITWQDKDITPAGLSDLTFGNIKITNKIGNPLHIDTLNDAYLHLYSSGIVDGVVLSDNVDGTIDLSAGAATLRAVPNPHTTLYSVEVLEQLNIGLTDNKTNYIILDWNAGSPEFVVSLMESSANGLDKFLTYIIFRNGNDLKWIDLREQNVDFIDRANELFRDFSKFIHAESGSLIQDNSNLSIFVQAGKFYHQTIPLPHPQFDTSIAGTENEKIYTLFNRNGGGWTETPGVKLIDTTLWDNNNVIPDVLGNNKYGVSWIHIGHDTPSFLNVVMGQQEYANLSNAENAFSSLPELPPILQGIGSLIGFVVYEKSVTTFDNILNLFEQRFVPVSASTVGLISVTNAEMLSITTPTASDQVYNTTWKAVYTFDGDVWLTPQLIKATNENAGVVAEGYPVIQDGAVGGGVDLTAIAGTISIIGVVKDIYGTPTPGANGEFITIAVSGEHNVNYSGTVSIGEATIADNVNGQATSVPAGQSGIFGIARGSKGAAGTALIRTWIQPTERF